MQKYVIKGMVQGEILYYAGKHYELSGSFSRNIFHATLYTIDGEAHNMVNLLEARFNAEFEIRPVKVTIVEMVPR